MVLTPRPGRGPASTPTRPCSAGGPVSSVRVRGYDLHAADCMQDLLLIISAFPLALVVGILISLERNKGEVIMRMSNAKWTAFTEGFSNQWPLKAPYNIA